MRISLFFSIIVIFAFISCSKNQSSKNNIAEQKLVWYYADVLILREEAKLRAMDSSTMKIRMDSLNQVYQINQEEIQTTLQNYKKDLTTWKGFYQKVIQRLDSLQQKELSRSKM
jgi:hypothetical protein